MEEASWVFVSYKFYANVLLSAVRLEVLIVALLSGLFGAAHCSRKSLKFLRQTVRKVTEMTAPVEFLMHLSHPTV